MKKMELIKEILNGMEYKDIRNGIWINTNDTYQEFFHHVHGDMLPDDFRYKMIHDVLSNMDDYEDHYELLESLIPVYTSDLLNWLSSNNTRYIYCDEFKEEYGISDERSVIDLISGGYMMELNEVYYLIVEWLDENTDEE